MVLNSTQSYQLIETKYSDNLTDSLDFCGEEESNIGCSPLADNDDLEEAPALHLQESFTSRNRSIFFTFITALGSFLSNIFIYLGGLLPSFITNIWEPRPAKKLNPTAYLNGLRSLAAYSVF